MKWSVMAALAISIKSHRDETPRLYSESVELVVYTYNLWGVYTFSCMLQSIAWGVVRVCVCVCVVCSYALPACSTQ